MEPSDPTEPTEINAYPPGQPSSGVIAGPGPNPLTPLSGLPHQGSPRVFGVSIKQGGASDALIDKMSSANIGQMITLEGQADARRHSESLAKIWSGVGLMVLIVFAILALCWMFLSFGKPEFLQGVLGLVIGALGGGGAGYGYGKASATKPAEPKP